MITMIFFFLIRAILDNPKNHGSKYPAQKIFEHLFHGYSLIITNFLL